MIPAHAHLVPGLFGVLDQKSCRAGFGDALTDLGEEDQNIVVLTGDLAESTKVDGFRDRFPARFFEAGVAEQNMMGIAAGLALAGKTPFLSSYATFSPGRSWDQFRVSVAYTGANVKVAGAHAGLSVGPDGATHQAMEDIAITRVLPGVTVVVPCDYCEAVKATRAIAARHGPAYMRFGRTATPAFTTPDSPFEIGRAEVLCDGGDLAIVACGPLVYEALLAARQLHSEGIEARVINSHTIKPLDVAALTAAAAETGAIVTVEEHQVHGGLGGAVAEVLAAHHPAPVEMVAMPDHFGESGPPGELLAKWGLTAPSIAGAARRVLARKGDR
ncbi:MAG: transketolase family protein [Streptosporangiaceae bacterium]